MKPHKSREGTQKRENKRDTHILSQHERKKGQGTTTKKGKAKQVLEKPAAAAVLRSEING